MTRKAVNKSNGRNGLHFLYVTGNSLNLLKREIQNSSKLPEGMLNLCDNPRYSYPRQYCYKDVNFPMKSFIPGEQINCLPPIASYRETTPIQMARDDTKDCCNMQLPNSSLKIKAESLKEDSVFNSQDDKSSSAYEKSAPMVNMSMGWKFIYSNNVIKQPRSDPLKPNFSTPLLTIKTITFSKATDRRCLKVATNNHSPTLAKPQLITPTMTCNLAREKVNGDEIGIGDSSKANRNNVNDNSFFKSDGKKCTPKMLSRCENEDTYGKTSSEFVQFNDLKAALCSSIDPKTKTKPSVGYFNNKPAQKVETNKSIYWQFDSKKHPQKSSSPRNVWNRRPGQTISGSIKDIQTDKSKSQTEKKMIRSKIIKSGLEGNKIAIPEQTNVGKLLNAVSFHRWINKLESCESDCQLLAERALAPMGSTFLELQEEGSRKKPRKQRSEIKQPKDCITALLETCKKRKQKSIGILGSSKRNRKRRPLVAKKDKNDKLKKY